MKYAQKLVIACFGHTKVLNSSGLQKRTRQTVQTQNRLLLKKQSEQVFPVYIYEKHFVNSKLDNQHFIENRKICVLSFRTFTIIKLRFSD